MRKNKEEQAKINGARVRNMLDNLPKIRYQLAGYYDDLRKIEHDVYEFNKKFSDAISAIHAVEMFYPGEEKAADEKLKSNIIPFPARNVMAGNTGISNIAVRGKPDISREGNIIYFPEAWREEAPDPAGYSTPEADPMPPFSEYRETFTNYGFGNFKYLQYRIYRALYNLRIRSLEELAKTPPKKISRERGVGVKTFAIIRDVLESNGIASEVWGIPEAAVTRQEN